MEDTLKIYGSYEASLSESKTMLGHNGIRYTVGGNARYVTRSNIIEWDTLDKSKSHINVINEILQLPEYVDDRETLYELLQEINKLPSPDFLRLLENSLNLKESLVIQLRRLFYIIDKMNAADKTYVRPTEYCPYEPTNRINKLLDCMKDTPDEDVSMYANIDHLVEGFDVMIIKKNKLYDTSINKAVGGPHTSKDKINAEMDIFIKSYTNAYDVLHNIENTNIDVAQSLEKILNNIENL